MKTILVVVMLFTFVSGATAQSNQCEDDLQALLELTSERCADLPANSACYGAGYVEMIDDFDNLIESVAEAGDTAFSENVAQIASFSTPDELESLGIAFVTMDIPETDHSVKLFIIGETDVVFELDVIDTRPTLYLDIVTFATGDDCADSTSGVLVQTPTGTPVAVDVNRAQVTLGSTVFFTVSDDRTLSVAPIEGAARVSIEGETPQTVVAGFTSEVELDPETNEATGEWSDVSLVDSDLLDEFEAFEAIDGDLLSYEFDAFDQDYLNELSDLIDDDAFDYDEYISDYDDYFDDEFIDDEDIVDDEDVIDDDDDFVDEEDDFEDDEYHDEYE